MSRKRIGKRRDNTPPFVMVEPTMASMQRLQELREDARAAGFTTIGEYVKAQREERGTDA